MLGACSSVSAPVSPCWFSYYSTRRADTHLLSRVLGHGHHRNARRRQVFSSAGRVVRYPPIWLGSRLHPLSPRLPGRDDPQVTLYDVRALQEGTSPLAGTL